MTIIEHEPGGDHAVVSRHPEEISAEYELRLGRYLAISARARITPAGVICAGLAAAAIILAAGRLAAVTAGRREKGG